jgi:hypothetical protein
MMKYLNTVNIVLSIVIIVLIIIYIINSNEYFAGYYQPNIKILSCNCNTDPGCSSDCPNYKSEYAPLSTYSS